MQVVMGRCIPVPNSTSLIAKASCGGDINESDGTSPHQRLRSLHDGVEAGDYVVDALIEFGHMGSSEVLTLGDNEGLVKTVRLKAKGGSKFHRRKITIICERLERKRYNVRHISTEQMPVDFMIKLIGKKKHRASIKYLYNLSNLVTLGVAA